MCYTGYAWTNTYFFFFGKKSSVQTFQGFSKLSRQVICATWFLFVDAAVAQSAVWNLKNSPPHGIHNATFKFLIGSEIMDPKRHKIMSGSDPWVR